MYLSCAETRIPMSDTSEGHLLDLFGHGHRSLDAFGTTQRFVRGDIDGPRFRRGVAISRLNAHDPKLPQDSDTLDQIDNIRVRVVTRQGYKSVVDYTTPAFGACSGSGTARCAGVASRAVVGHPSVISFDRRLSTSTAVVGFGLLVGS